MQTSQPHFSKSADNNKDHILAQLRDCLKDGDKVLEIASGTGQHAVHFSTHIPNIIWQTSDIDLETYDLSDIVSKNARDNLPSPIALDVNAWPSPQPVYDAVYSANCLHIVDETKVKAYIAGAALSLKQEGALLLYGPYKYDGHFTTPSNQKFDGFLRSTYPGGGIRDFEWIDELAKRAGLLFESDTAMPANNQFLIWRKSAS